MTKHMHSAILTMFAAGLAGNRVTMKCSAIDAIGRLLYEQRESLDPAMRDSAIKTILILINDQERPVYKCVLRFIKVIIFVTPVENLAAYLPSIFQMFSNAHHNSTNMA